MRWFIHHQQQHVAHGNPIDDEFSRLFHLFFGSHQPKFCPTERAWTPPTDIYETQDAIHVRMELAGVNREDIEITAHGHYVTIRGQRHEVPQCDKEKYHLLEIQYGKFERVIKLPFNLSTTSITAELQNGFLLITIPKPSEPQEIRIEIQ